MTKRCEKQSKSEKNTNHRSKISSTAEEKDTFVVSAKWLKLHGAVFAAGAFSVHRNILMTALVNDLIVVQRRIVAHGTNSGQFNKAVIVSTLDRSVSFQSGMKIQRKGRLHATALYREATLHHKFVNIHEHERRPVVQGFKCDWTHGVGAAGGHARACLCSWKDTLIAWQPRIFSQEKAKPLLVKLPLNNPHSPHSYGQVQTERCAQRTTHKEWPAAAFSHLINQPPTDVPPQTLVKWIDMTLVIALLNLLVWIFY